jgi:acyl-[acyl-carrier-protein]-phospholipid O-acyltransferase / long-chain-fatty-acid--[acyl-carrier-protein] ligase
VALDSDGFLRIQGRAKRFAKVAGEMVSLGAVEEFALQVSSGYKHAAVTRPDPRKGEQIVLVTEDPLLTRSRFVDVGSARGMPPIMMPAEVIYLGHLPVLGTGKTDYPGLERAVRDAALPGSRM